eukprot:SAG31_NODE_23288_length_507_cov_0.889706_1_plen_66_part_01
MSARGHSNSILSHASSYIQVKNEPGTDQAASGQAASGQAASGISSEPKSWTQSEHQRFLEGLQLYQ